jgi:hypothetical protein
LQTQNTGICGRSRYSPTLGELIESNTHVAAKMDGVAKTNAETLIAHYSALAAKFGLGAKLAEVTR